MILKTQATFAMLAATVLMVGCGVLSWVSGSIATRIGPNAEKGLVSLQCQASSTGACYFLVGEAFETAYEVRQGESRDIASPDRPLPVCSTHSASFRLHCNKRTTIGPEAAVVYQSVAVH